MEEFDFNVPINTTLIYDDSDDEIQSDIEIIEDGTKFNTSESEMSKTHKSHLSNEYHGKVPAIKTKISKENIENEFKMVRSNEIQNKVTEFPVTFEIENFNKVNKCRTIRFTTKNKSYKSKENSLDILCLKEDNSNSLKHSSIIEQAYTKATDTNRQVSKKRINSIRDKSEPKRRLTKEINLKVASEVVDECDHLKMCKNQNYLQGNDKSILCLEEDNLNSLEHSYFIEQADTKATDTNRQVSKKRRNSIRDKSEPKRRLTKEINPNVDSDVVDECDYLKICKNQNSLRRTDKSETDPCISSSENSFKYIHAQPDVNIPLSNLNSSTDQSVTYHAGNSEINISSVQKQNQPVTNIISPDTQIIIDYSATNYIKEILKTVSEHMINIINTYQTVGRISKTKNESHFEAARNNFIRTRNHFFELSYNSVLNIIIPRQEDALFLKNFIDDTIELANSKSYPLTYLHIGPLLFEMIEWVRRRQRDIQNKGLKKQKRVLSDRGPPPPYNDHIKQVQPTELNTCGAYTQGPPKRSLHSVPRNSNIHNEQILPCGCPVDMPSRNEYKCYYKNKIHNSQSNQKTTNRFSGSTVHEDTANMEVLSRFWDSAEGLMQKQNTRMPETRTSNPSKAQTKPHAQMQTTQPRDNKRTNFCEHEATRAWETRAPQNWINREVQSCQKLVPEALETGDLQFDQHPLNQLYNIAQISGYLNPEPQSQAQTEPNRSLSRDSGFMSPLNFNSSTDQTYNTQTQEPATQPTAPIAHVTSLNPNASYITEGFCTICGKTTRNKCLGCYKSYYCSHMCQHIDWKNHRAVCK